MDHDQLSGAAPKNTIFWVSSPPGSVRLQAPAGGNYGIKIS